MTRLCHPMTSYECHGQPDAWYLISVSIKTAFIILSDGYYKSYDTEIIKYIQCICNWHFCLFSTSIWIKFYLKTKGSVTWRKKKKGKEGRREKGGGEKDKTEIWDWKSLVKLWYWPGKLEPWILVDSVANMLFPWTFKSFSLKALGLPSVK